MIDLDQFMRNDLNFDSNLLYVVSSWNQVLQTSEKFCSKIKPETNLFYKFETSEHNEKTGLVLEDR